MDDSTGGAVLDTTAGYRLARQDWRQGERSMRNLNGMQPAGWLGIGVALGAGIGVALGNVALGAGVGIALGAAMMSWQKRAHEKQRDDPPGS